MAPSAMPLQGCIIALSGSFPGHSQSSLEADFILVSGATLARTINEDTTHLITTKSEFEKPSGKVKQAKSHDIPIVKLAWLEDCLEQAKRLSEDAYSFDAQDDDDAPANGKKRTASVGVDDKSQSQPNKKAKTPSTNGSQAPKVKKEAEDGPLNVAKSSVVNIPLDETCPLTHYQIYVDVDGVIYDASLNQTNAGKNNNKFYKLQV